MTDTELDRLVARANPIGDEPLARLPVSDAETDLLEEIVSTPAPAGTAIRSRVIVVLAAAAVAAVVAVGAIVLPGRSTSPIQSSPTNVATGKNYEVLLDAPGWTISRANEYDATSGELTFGNGDKQMSVTWYPAATYRSYYDDREHGNNSQQVQVLGQTATMFQYANGTDYATMLPPNGATFLEIRADLGSEQVYRDTIGKLRRVDRDTWLAAMPAGIVTPDHTKAAVDQMLADVPAPSGLDREALEKPAMLERYQLGARVSGAVTCAWIGQWDKARKAGDAAKAKQAADALATSRSWKILQEMNPEGDYPEVVWEYSDTIVKHGKLPEGYKGGLGCR
jgi:hypothetical protein